MYKRLFDPLSPQKSYFLLGPRQTGKSTLLKQVIPLECYVDLLNPSVFFELHNRPEVLVERMRALIFEEKFKKKEKITVVIDEIQKIPTLLDTIQYIMGEMRQIQFIMTGSSARKLRSAGQNLLGGRAHKVSFHPLTLKEISDFKFPVTSAMRWGGLPGVHSSMNPQQELLDYVGVYLKEEIEAEARVRNTGNFVRFLSVAGLCNTEQVNYEKIGNDAQVSPSTVRDYFDILEDTLIAQRLMPFKPRISRKFVSTPKFYFFDWGVSQFINKKSADHLSPQEQGKALENLIYVELKAYLSYLNLNAELYFWRTQTGHEVDFVLQNQKNEFFGIEVKATKSPNEQDLKGLRELQGSIPLKRKIVVCNVERARRSADDCEILPIMVFVKKLWSGELGF